MQAEKTMRLTSIAQRLNVGSRGPVTGLHYHRLKAQPVRMRSYN